MADENLIVRLHSLGDVILASGTARSMAECSPLTFVTRPEYEPAVRRIPGNIEVVPFAGNWITLRRLSKGFSIIVDLQGNLTTRAAFAGKKNVRRFRFNRALRRRILRGSGESLPWRASEYMNAWGGSGDPAPVLERKGFPEDGKRTIGIVVGGRWPMKAIPDGIAAELARLFCDGIGAHVLLLGETSDRKRAIDIAEQCGYRNVEPAAGEGGIGRLIERTESLDLLISPDSGPAHLGIALGVPTQVIFTSTSPSLGFYSPGLRGAFLVQGLSCRPCHRHGGIRCINGDLRCRSMLLPREIYEEALCLMR